MPSCRARKELKVANLCKLGIQEADTSEGWWQS
jgi:hypothetical protein